MGREVDGDGGSLRERLDLYGRVDAVAEDNESSDSARTSTLFISILNSSSDASNTLESEYWHFLQNVAIEGTSKHSRHPTSDPPRDGSADSRP